MPTFARRPTTTSSYIPVDIPQSSMVGQQRQQISELQYDKFPTPSTFSCWKIVFENQVTTCSDFPSEAMLCIKKVVSGKNFLNFEMLDARKASALNKIIQNSHFKKKVSLEEQNAQKEDRFATTFESLALTIPFLVTPMYSLSLFATTTFRNSIRDGMKKYYLRPRSVQIKNT